MCITRKMTGCCAAYGAPGPALPARIRLCGLGRAGRRFGCRICSRWRHCWPAWTATAANVTVNPADGSFTVNKLTVGTDLGTLINPNAVEAQVQGATLWGLSLATLEEVEMKDGRIQASNFDTYTPCRMENAPELDVILIETGQYPVGCGEPAVTSVAPAIANAIYAASGARVRSLPITAEKVKAAL